MAGETTKRMKLREKDFRQPYSTVYIRSSSSISQSVSEMGATYIVLVSTIAV